MWNTEIKTEIELFSKKKKSIFYWNERRFIYPKLRTKVQPKLIFDKNQVNHEPCFYFS